MIIHTHTQAHTDSHTHIFSFLIQDEWQNQVCRQAVKECHFVCRNLELTLGLLDLLYPTRLATTTSYTSPTMQKKQTYLPTTLYPWAVWMALMHALLADCVCTSLEPGAIQLSLITCPSVCARSHMDFRSYELNKRFCSLWCRQFTWHPGVKRRVMMLVFRMKGLLLHLFCPGRKCLTAARPVALSIEA